MSILVKLYGDLKRKTLVQKEASGIPDTLKIEINKGNTVFDLLKQFNIKEKEVSHVFVNGVYCGLGKVIRGGDRIGIFPRRMGIMFLEITKTKSIDAKIKLDNTIGQLGSDIINVEFPEGITVVQLLSKYNISTHNHDLRILVNEKKMYKKDYIIRNGDNLEIFPITRES